MNKFLMRLYSGMGYKPFSEWVFIGINELDDYGDKHCECGHKIKYEYIFQRKNKQIIIGSKCQKLFPLTELPPDIRKIQLNINKSLKRSSIYYVSFLHIIGEWERDFYLNIYRKRKLSERQQYYKTKINQKILKHYVKKRQKREVEQ